jgi:hypothetical protein
VFITFFQRGAIHKISKVLGGVSPPLYILSDLQDHRVKGHYYAEQLKIAPKPDDLVFEVEKIIKKKKIRGKNYFFVKYLNYSSVFFTNKLMCLKYDITWLCILRKF